LANKRVNIYERLKINGKWSDRPVQLPKLTRDETLNPKDDRDGRFYASWYDGRKKCRHPEPLKLLSDAVKIKVAKEFYLRNRKRSGVSDPTVPKHRLPIAASAEDYLSALSGCKNTKKEHRYAVREFVAWNREICGYEFRKRFVDEIDKAHLMRFMDYLVDDEPDNCPFTAAWKLMRTNKWIRTVLRLDPGKGPIKKSDLRRELESNAVAEIYTNDELQALFAVMNQEEFLRYLTFLKSGLRKKELMFLEDDDAIIEFHADGREKREIRVERKNHYDFMPKNGKSRNVPVPRDLAELLLERKQMKRPGKLLFSTKTGAPDRHMLEKLRAIAKRAGLDPSHFWLHKFRATYAVGRLRAGVDVDTVREWLGHKDSESLRAYLVHLKNEEAIALGKVDAGHLSLISHAARTGAPAAPGTSATLPILQFPVRELRWR
jgi:integrase/recombinase XerD